MRHDEITAAAEVALAGMNPWTFLTEKRVDRRVAMQAIAAEYERLDRARGLERANQIAGEVSKIFRTTK